MNTIRQSMSRGFLSVAVYLFAIAALLFVFALEAVGGSAIAFEAVAGLPRESLGAFNLQFGMGLGEQYQRTGLNYETSPLWSGTLGALGRMDFTLEAGVAYWSNTDGTMHNEELLQLTVLPLLRWWVFEPFFIEGGVGPSVFSSRSFAGKDISTHFQFADQIGGGVRLSESLRLSIRYAHFSNGGMRRPNPGLNVIMVSLAYDF